MLNFFEILQMIAFAFSVSSPNEVEATYPRGHEAVDRVIPALERKIENMMKVQHVPGMAIAIVAPDRVVYLKTFGVKQLGRPEKILPSTLFQMASLSKPIHATMMAILQERGKLAFHDPVNHYIPDFKIRNGGKPLRICHLMSHSTGVLNHGFDGQIQAFIPYERIVSRLKKVPVYSPPGTHFDYNNAMYGLVGEIISKTTGKSVEQALHDELFSPLRMNHASVGYQALLQSSDRAYPHMPNGRGRYIPADHYSRAYYNVPAAGGVNASVQDLVPFLQLYVGKKFNFVSNHSLQNLTHPYVKNTKAVGALQVRQSQVINPAYCLGWQSMTYANQKVIYHQGHLKGFRHFMGYKPNDVGIVVLSNADRKHAAKIALAFFDLYNVELNKNR